MIPRPRQLDLAAHRMCPRMCRSVLPALAERRASAMASAGGPKPMPSGHRLKPDILRFCRQAIGIRTHMMSGRDDHVWPQARAVQGN